VLDTTDPAAIARVVLEGTTFVAASKSGTTIETTSQLAHFWEATGGDANAFVAITDPGTGLATLARERGFAAVFENRPDIGGRYSALSWFGLVPATMLGVDAARLLDRAASVDDADGVRLGAILGAAARAGRDKLTLVLPEAIASFGVWLEQLLAESTGKHGKGLVPVRYGDSADVQRPDFRVDDPYEAGQEFFRWEFATAVAGSILGINPFDQPDVQAAKDKTSALL